mgnify:FL=1
MRGRLIIVDGPIASGKTTVKAIIKELLRGRAWAITQSPFALITYLLTKTIVALILNKQCEGAYPISCLKTKRPLLLAKLLNILVMLDLIQSIAIAAASKILNTMGINVVIEDYTPTIILDHILYKKLYTDIDTNNLVANIYEINLSLLQTLKPVGIYVNADRDVRVKRSIARGYRVVRPETLHDNVRSSILIKVMNATIGQVYMVDNNGSLEETRRQIINVLTKLNE